MDDKDRVVVPPPPMSSAALRSIHRIVRWAELDIMKRAEAQASEALGLDLSQYTNAELDTVKMAARAEKRRRWLATMGRGHGDETTKA